MNNKCDLLKGLTIGVLYGGPSAERDVSIESGESVAKALEEAGHDVHRVLLDGTFSARDARSLGIDVAFLALHGEFGEDGRIQQILEDADVPYTGSGVDASSMAFDKVLAKRAFERNGVRTPAWMSLELAELERGCGITGMYLVPPLVIKPAASGSSLGITIARDPQHISAGVRKAFEYDDTILIERYIKGRELTVGILGDKALPVIELQVATEFFDFQSKYKTDTTRKICPADLPADTTQRMQELALSAHRALGCRDVSRTDIILGSDGLGWVLEVNTLPGMTSHSLLPIAAAKSGKNFTQLCEELLRLALEHSLQTKAA